MSRGQSADEAYHKSVQAFSKDSAETTKLLQFSLTQHHPYARWFLCALLWNGSRVSRKDRDEALFLLRHIVDEDVTLEQAICLIHDSDGRRAHRCLLQTLLVADLKRNSESPLHRSFFHHSTFEVNLLPIIIDYVVPKLDCIPEASAEEERSGESGGLASRLVARGDTISIETELDAFHFVFMDTSKVSCFRVHFSHLLPLLCLLDTSSMSSLDVSRTLADDLSPLARLNTRGLEWLNLKDSAIKDLSPLVGVDTSSLKVLFLGATFVKDLSPLQHIDTSSLLELRLGSTRVSDLSAFPLMNTCALQDLDLCNSQVEDLSPLANTNLCQLRELLLDFTRVSDLSPLAASNPSQLRILSLSHTNVSDIDPLSSMDTFCLERLLLDYTLITSMSPLSRMDTPKLTHLNIRNTRVSDLSPLFDIDSELEDLDARKTDASTLLLTEPPPWLKAKVKRRLLW